MSHFRAVNERSRGSGTVRVPTEAEIRRRLQAFVADLRPLRRYPTKRAGSRYRRTRKLQRSWTARVRGTRKEISGALASRSTVAPYNKIVQGANQSRRMKQRGWVNVPVAANLIWKTRHRPGLVRRLQGR